MLIGVPREIKADEYRVALIPSTIRELVSHGHEVLVETCAGQGAGISDEEYAAAGAGIIATASEIFERAELIIKVKEPLVSERKRLQGGQIIFTYLHLAPDREQTNDLLQSGVTAIAYETVTDAAGNLPLLAPMSKVAGRMAAQVAAHFLERPYGGRGVLLGGVDEVAPAKIVVLGGGVVGHGSGGHGHRAKHSDNPFAFSIIWRARSGRNRYARDRRVPLHLGRRRDRCRFGCGCEGS